MILLLDEDSCTVTLSNDEMSTVSVDLSNINLDNVDFIEDDPETTNG